MYVYIRVYFHTDTCMRISVHIYIYISLHAYPCMYMPVSGLSACMMYRWGVSAFVQSDRMCSMYAKTCTRVFLASVT